MATTTRRRRTAADRLMNEVAIYGGLLMRRCDIHTLCLEHLPETGRKPFGADFFAFSPPAVDLEPWPLDEARRIMG